MGFSVLGMTTNQSTAVAFVDYNTVPAFAFCLTHGIVSCADQAEGHFGRLAFGHAKTNGDRDCLPIILEWFFGNN